MTFLNGIVEIGKGGRGDGAAPAPPLPHNDCAYHVIPKGAKRNEESFEREKTKHTKVEKSFQLSHHGNVHFFQDLPYQSASLSLLLSTP